MRVPAVLAKAAAFKFPHIIPPALHTMIGNQILGGRPMGQERDIDEMIFHDEEYAVSQR
jgi:hypothetical protein